MTKTTSRPASTTKCTECKGTGREVETTEITDEAGDFLREETKDFGPCEVCDGRGWFARETKAERKAREDQERTATRTRYAREAAEHKTTCPGRMCPAPYRYHAEW